MTAIAAAKKAIEDATELPEAETTVHAMLVNAHANVLATAKESRMAVLDDKSKEEQAIAQAATNKAVGTKAKAIGNVMVAGAFDAVDVTVTAKRAGPEIKVEGDDDFTHVMGPMYSLMHDADDDGNVVQEIVLVDHTITTPEADFVCEGV